ncbi:hypothetical protein H5410_015271 [Solanum commersonii]|uniref:O-methyltransferase n=1 Tax=Solanum commersonii TaxID=4109 RepID=A0A9J5ZTZ2_SOLCO|nr:hypothetical protein H5410_015271 [Solanum commersonii]
MESDARLIMSVLIKNGKRVFEGLTSLVDVGGGIGTVAKAISNAFPELKCSVFDLPHVVEGLEGGNNLSYIAGDMFKSVPSADAILLKWILHDWSDEDCAKILKKCKEAIPSKENGGKEMTNHLKLSCFGCGDDGSSGKERNEQEWAKLFSDAGFSDYKISPILGLRETFMTYDCNFCDVSQKWHCLCNDIGDETRQVLAAQAHIWNHIFNYINSMSLKCAIQLEIPDIIHSHGRPMNLSDLVEALPINNNHDKAKTHDCVYRLMRILVHAGFFIQEAEEGYLLTPTSHLLLKDEPMSMIPFLNFQLDPNLMDPWHSLSKWFNNVSDESNSTPYATAHGMPFFKYAENEPRLNHLFNEAMASDTRLVMTVLIQNGKGLIFEGLKSLVDRGTGTIAKAIADAFPQINCTVFELPHVIEGLEGSKNLSFVGGDMFNSIPSANAILLKWILHDWSDGDCIKILKKCKEAIPSKENGGKVILIEIVMDQNKDNDKSYETQLLIDMLIDDSTKWKEKAKNGQNSFLMLVIVTTRLFLS